MTDRNAYAFPMLDNNGNYVQYGVTIREQFAAMAMQGIISNGAEMRDENIAGAAVALADALIQALNKEEQ